MCGASSNPSHQGGPGEPGEESVYGETTDLLLVAVFSCETTAAPREGDGMLLGTAAAADAGHGPESRTCYGAPCRLGWSLLGGCLVRASAQKAQESLQRDFLMKGGVSGHLSQLFLMQKIFCFVFLKTASIEECLVSDFPQNYESREDLDLGKDPDVSLVSW